MLTGIKEILIISKPQDFPNFERFLGDGNQSGINLSYKVQLSPDGLAQAFIIGKEFIDDESVKWFLEMIFSMVVVYQQFTECCKKRK